MCDSGMRAVRPPPRQNAHTAIHQVEKRGRQGLEKTSFAASTFFAKLLHYLELWAGLLASGSLYSPRLPVPWDSGSCGFRRRLQQRDCGGFAPPSLTLIQIFVPGAPSFQVCSSHLNPRPLYGEVQELSSRKSLCASTLYSLMFARYKSQNDHGA